MRTNMAATLAVAQPSVFADYVHAKRQLDSFRAFVQNSSRFPTSSTGRINSYPLFVECTATLVSNNGMTGQIVPSAIAMDAYNAALFRWLAIEGRLVQMLDFENREGLFAHVHRSYRFSLLTLRGSTHEGHTFQFLFFGHDPAEVALKDRVLQLSLEDLQLCSPNTLAPPMLQSARDATIALDVYRRFGVLVQRHDKSGLNTWSVSIQRMLSLSDPGNLFQTTDRLAKECEGADLEEWTRLYSGKTIHHFNHRFSTWSDADWEKLSLAQLVDPSFKVTTEYAVRISEVAKRTNGKTPSNWLIGYRDVCRATDERTAIAAIIPHVGCDTHCRNVYFESAEPSRAASFVAIFNSFVFDYFCRQKVVAIGLGSGVVEQLPFLHPDLVSQATPWDSTTHCGQYIVARVIELVYTAHDLKPFAQDLGYSIDPFIWDESRRAVIRAELDAALFHLYGINEADIDYILETFPIVKSKDIERFGSYRTKEMILRCYQEMQEAIADPTGQTVFASQLDPPPGVPVPKDLFNDPIQPPREKLVVQAFDDTRNGTSTEFVVCDPATNARYIRRVQELMPRISEYDANWDLYRIRKQGGLAHLKDSKTSHGNARLKPYEFAVEWALRYQMDKHNTSFERILCDPELRTQFDDSVRKLKTGDTVFDVFDFRWAAITIRKRFRNIPPVTPSLFDEHIPLSKADSVLPEQPGVYLIYSASKERLYTGWTENLKFQFEYIRIAGEGTIIPNWLLADHAPAKTFAFHVFDAGTPDGPLHDQWRANLRGQRPLLNLFEDQAA
jgi:hypothetical protein